MEEEDRQEEGGERRLAVEHELGEGADDGVNGESLSELPGGAGHDSDECADQPGTGRVPTLAESCEQPGEQRQEEAVEGAMVGRGGRKKALRPPAEGSTGSGTGSRSRDREG